MSPDQRRKVSQVTHTKLWSMSLNRGRQHGIKVIAIYSEIDSASLHVMLADEAYLLRGPARSAYLDGYVLDSSARSYVAGRVGLALHHKS